MIRAVSRLLLALLLALPGLVQAQGAVTLVVRLRDLTSVGVVGAQITVRDAAGAHELARATTDQHGRTSIVLPELAAVRVAVAGVLPDGTPLVQRGQDSQGIWLMLDGPQVALDLRIEPDGAVVPDPATMIAPDVPLAVVPATPVVSMPVSPALPMRVAPRAAPAEGSSMALAPLLLLALGIALGGVVLAWRSGRQS